MRLQPPGLLSYRQLVNTVSEPVHVALLKSNGTELPVPGLAVYVPAPEKVYNCNTTFSHLPLLAIKIEQAPYEICKVSRLIVST